MTVCLAIACECTGDDRAKPTLILISDHMFSIGITSSEAGLKARRLGPNSSIMFAGNDVSLVPAVIGYTRARLDESKNYSDNNVVKTVIDAYQVVRKKQIEDTFLSSFDWTMEEFLKNGRNALPPAYFLRLLAEIERFDLGCEFLVAGFGQSDATLPTMFTVGNPGVFLPQGLTGYAAIGSGALNAIAYLDRRNQSVNLSLAESLYNGIAAKNLAERAIGVGPATNVMIMERGSEAEFLPDEKVDAIMKIWKEEEENIRPRLLQQRVSEVLK